MGNFDQAVIKAVMWPLVIAFVISICATPLVRRLAFRIGAVDVPKDNRRMHTKPIARLGGLAIFLGFVVSVLLFVHVDRELRGILFGAIMIVILGIFDDIYSLRAKLKLVVQIMAASIAVWHGVAIEVINNPNVFSREPYWVLGWLSIPVSIIWIVAITNSVNLIDGLDGLADGVSTIGALTMLVIAVLLGEGEIAMICAALVGACVGFMPYNLNPARIFMGDTGATFLGFILASVSIQGLFKYYAVISFLVPFIILGLPIFDTTSAFLRRIARGQSPMVADRSHIHHKLIDMGMNQKQAVATLYMISAVLGLCAVTLTSTGGGKILIFLAALVLIGVIAARMIHQQHQEQGEQEKQKNGRQKDH